MIETAGIGVGQGWAAGTAHIVRSSERIIPQYRIGRDQVESECKRLQNALEGVNERLNRLKRSLRVLPNMDPFLIVEVYQSMLDDRSLREDAFERIQRQRINAEWAVEQAIGEVQKVFETIADPYIRARLDDIVSLQEMVHELLDVDARTDDINSELRGSVVVARDLAPHFLLSVARSGAAGVVLERGNASGHAAIIAKSMGLPMVIGVENVLERIAHGTNVALSASRGIVYLNPDTATLQSLEIEKISESVLWEEARVALVTKDGQKIQILANVDVPDELRNGRERCVDGIGLVRTEIAYLGATPPTEEELEAQYRGFFHTMGGADVTFRVLDIGGDKVAEFVDPENRDPSALGLRGVRFLFQHPALLSQQLRALCRAADDKTLRVMVPMVTDVREMRRFRSELDRARDQVGYKNPVMVGAMVETPAASMIMPALRAEVDFFSVGSNDLIQYLLCVDRANHRVRQMYNPMHPAVLRTLKRVFREAQGTPITICGEIASDFGMLALLIGMGYRSFSMPLIAVPKVKQSLRNVRVKDCKQLFKTCEQASVGAEIEALVEVFRRKHAVSDSEVKSGGSSV